MSLTQFQIDLFQKEIQKNAGFKKESFNQEGNRLNHNDRSFHDWYRFVLSFPPHLVRNYLKDFNLNKNSMVLDPFCGTGTTLIESKLNFIKSVGIEANPVAYFASSVKVNWNISTIKLQSLAKSIAQKTLNDLLQQGIDDSNLIIDNLDHIKLRTIDKDAHDLLLKNSISPLPLHKTLVLLGHINDYKQDDCYNHLLLALAKALVAKIGNLKFGPEVGITKPKKDIHVVNTWLNIVDQMVHDIKNLNNKNYPESIVIFGDSRNVELLIKPNSIDAIITSPPYPNEKDYSRTTRLESVVLGFINSKEQLRNFKKTFVRSNTRGIYKDDDDYKWILENKEILKLSEQIEKRRLELGKTSGFEKLYPIVTQNSILAEWPNILKKCNQS